MITIPGNFPVDLVATPAQNGAGDPERAFLVHEDNNGAPRGAGARGVPVGGANIDALPVLAGFGVGVGAWSPGKRIVDDTIGVFAAIYICIYSYIHLYV